MKVNLALMHYLLVTLNSKHMQFVNENKSNLGILKQTRLKNPKTQIIPSKRFQFLISLIRVKQTELIFKMEFIKHTT